MELTSHRVHLFFSFPEQISDRKLLRRYESLLSDAESAQMARFYYAGHRHQYLVTRALIRSSLSTFFPVDPATWKFTAGAYGKPDIEHPEVEVPLRFNISHTQGLIVCAIVRGYDIGVDTEDTERSTRTDLDSLASYFSPQEIDEIRNLPASRQKQRFFDYWTLKESYIKARGLGLAIPLDKFSFLFRDDRLDGFQVHADLNDAAGNWQFWRVAVNRRYKVALALNAAGVDIELSACKTIPMASNERFPLTVL